MAKTLRAWRTERLLSTRRLAELAGSSNKTIVQLENGRQTATFATIEKLSRVLQVEPRDVTEFARAIDVRAGVASDALSVAEPLALRKTHVYCVGATALFHSLASQLLESGRHGVSLVAGVPVTPEQLACARPDVVVLDLDDGSARALLHGLLDGRAANPAPIVVTSEDQSALDALAATLEQSGATGLTFAPLDQDIHELVSAVESSMTTVMNHINRNGTFMDQTVANGAFRAMLAHYEDGGWEVRTLDAAGMRATVRTSTQPPVAEGHEPEANAPLRLPACRRLWVDAAGSVQETNVPC